MYSFLYISFTFLSIIITYDEILDLAEASHRRIDKKYADDPSYIIRKRVANTATEVIRKVKDLAFSDLATDMYLICDEVGYKFFSSKYRNVIEFAKLHPEKLFDQLYKYLRDTAREIKKNNLLQEFFLFMSVLSEATRISTEHREIFLAYLYFGLILCFNVNAIKCGCFNRLTHLD